MASPFPYQRGPHPTPANATISRTTRPSKESAFDKFPAGEFDSWIGGLTHALKGALVFEAKKPAPSYPDIDDNGNNAYAGVARDGQPLVSGQDPDRSAFPDESIVEDSFADVRTRRVGKGKARDVRDGPGFGSQGGQDAPIELLDSDEEGEGEEEDEAEQGERIHGLEDQYGEGDEDEGGVEREDELEDNEIYDQDVMDEDEEDRNTPYTSAGRLPHSTQPDERSPVYSDEEENYVSDAENIPPPGMPQAVLPQDNEEEYEEEEGEEGEEEKERDGSSPLREDQLWDVGSDDEPLRPGAAHEQSPTPEPDHLAASSGLSRRTSQIYEDTDEVPFVSDDEDAAPRRRSEHDEDEPSYEEDEDEDEDQERPNQPGVQDHDNNGYDDNGYDDEEDGEEASLNSEELAYEQFKREIEANASPTARVSKSNSRPEVITLLDSDDEDQDRHIDQGGDEDQEEEANVTTSSPPRLPPKEIYHRQPSPDDYEELHIPSAAAHPQAFATVPAPEQSAPVSLPLDVAAHKELDNRFGAPREVIIELPPTDVSESLLLPTTFASEDSTSAFVNQSGNALPTTFAYNQAHASLGSAVYEDPIQPGVLDDFARMPLIQQDVDLADVWTGPATYAEDFYSGGPLPETLGGGVTPSHLTPIPTPILTPGAGRADDPIELMDEDDDDGGDGGLPQLRYPDNDENEEQFPGGNEDGDVQMDYADKEDTDLAALVQADNQLFDIDIAQLPETIVGPTTDLPTYTPGYGLYEDMSGFGSVESAQPHDICESMDPFSALAHPPPPSIEFIAGEAAQVLAQYQAEQSAQATQTSQAAEASGVSMGADVGTDFASYPPVPVLSDTLAEQAMINSMLATVQDVSTPGDLQTLEDWMRNTEWAPAVEAATAASALDSALDAAVDLPMDSNMILTSAFIPDGIATAPGIDDVVPVPAPAPSALDVNEIAEDDDNEISVTVEEVEILPRSPTPVNEELPIPVVDSVKPEEFVETTTEVVQTVVEATTVEVVTEEVIASLPLSLAEVLPLVADHPSEFQEAAPAVLVPKEVQPTENKVTPMEIQDAVDAASIPETFGVLDAKPVVEPSTEASPLETRSPFEHTMHIDLPSKVEETHDPVDQSMNEQEATPTASATPLETPTITGSIDKATASQLAEDAEPIKVDQSIIAEQTLPPASEDTDVQDSEPTTTFESAVRTAASPAAPVSETTSQSGSSHSSNPQLPTPDSNSNPQAEDDTDTLVSAPFGARAPASLLLPGVSSHLRAVAQGAPLPNLPAPVPADFLPNPSTGVFSPFLAAEPPTAGAAGVEGSYFDILVPDEPRPAATPVAMSQPVSELADVLRGRTLSASSSYGSLAALAGPPLSQASAQVGPTTTLLEKSQEVQGRAPAFESAHEEGLGQDMPGIQITQPASAIREDDEMVLEHDVVADGSDHDSIISSKEENVNVHDQPGLMAEEEDDKDAEQINLSSPPAEFLDEVANEAPEEQAQEIVEEAVNDLDNPRLVVDQPMRVGDDLEQSQMQAQRQTPLVAAVQSEDDEATRNGEEKDQLRKDISEHSTPNTLKPAVYSKAIDTLIESTPIDPPTAPQQAQAAAKEPELEDDAEGSDDLEYLDEVSRGDDTPPAELDSLEDEAPSLINLPEDTTSRLEKEQPSTSSTPLSQPAKALEELVVAPTVISRNDLHHPDVEKTPRATSVMSTSSSRRARKRARRADDGSDADAETDYSGPESEHDPPSKAARDRPHIQIPGASESVPVLPLPTQVESTTEINGKDGFSDEDDELVSSAVNPSPPRASLVETKTFSLPEVPLAQRGNVYHQHTKPTGHAGVTALPGRPAVLTSMRRPPSVIQVPTFNAVSGPSSMASPTPSQASQRPLSQASQTSQASQPQVHTQRVTRHSTMKSSPVTRSHCKYHKISVELFDDGPRAMFVVPGCALVNRDFMAQEDIIDHGDAAVEDMNRIEADIESLDIAAELISNLKLLVGVDVLRELDMFYLPQDSVPIIRKRQRPAMHDPLAISAGRHRRRDSSIRAGPSASQKRKRKDDERSDLAPSRKNSGTLRNDDNVSVSSVEEGSRTSAGTASVAQSTPTKTGRGTVKLLLGKRATPPTPLAGPSSSSQPMKPADTRKSRSLRADMQGYDSMGNTAESSSAEENQQDGAWKPGGGQKRKRRRGGLEREIHDSSQRNGKKAKMD